MTNKTFLVRVSTIVVALLVISACAITSILVLRWLTPSEVMITEVEIKEEVVSEKDVIKDDGFILVTETDSLSGHGLEIVCKFAEDFTSLGKVVPAGTPVKGPAFVKPDRDVDWGYPVYVGEEYTTRASDEVIWLLAGDNICVEAQGQFFSSWGKTNPNN